MRKVTYGAACSLDMFIASADGRVDWILWCDEAMAVMSEFWKSIDTVVLGRKTYDIAQGQSTGDSTYSGVTSYVCSRTLTPGRYGPVEIVADGVALVRDLKTRPGKDICIMGGGDLAASLLDAGLIDEIGMSIHPILLGSGVPFFGPLGKQVKLQLVKSDTWKNGCVMVTYKVQK